MQDASNAERMYFINGGVADIGQMQEENIFCKQDMKVTIPNSEPEPECEPCVNIDGDGE